MTENEDPKFNPSFLLICVLFSGSAGFAQNLPHDISGCLPPKSGERSSNEDCFLTYVPPPKLRHDIVVGECEFLPESFQMKKRFFTSFQCSIVNESEEEVESFRYGVRFFDWITGNLLVEDGFESSFRYSSGNIDGGFQPNERLTLRFSGPDVPDQFFLFSIDIEVEVTGVYVPGSRLLR